MSELEDNMHKLARQFRHFADDLRMTTDSRDGEVLATLLIAGIWDKAASHIEETIKDTNRWHQEPT